MSPEEQLEYLDGILGELDLGVYYHHIVDFVGIDNKDEYEWLVIVHKKSVEVSYGKNDELYPWRECPPEKLPFLIQKMASMFGKGMDFQVDVLIPDENHYLDIATLSFPPFSCIPELKMKMELGAKLKLHRDNRPLVDPDFNLTNPPGNDIITA